MAENSELRKLASYCRCVDHISSCWRKFLETRALRLQEGKRLGRAAEKVAENIIEDLFTGVLDWSLADMNHQVEGADLLLTQQGIKYLLIEVKRPGALAWHQRSVERALDQALRYAAEQKVRCVAISDGTMLYAANISGGGLTDRCLVSLAREEAPTDLWWLSVHGIYRERTDSHPGELRLLAEAPEEEAGGTEQETANPELLHPKYGLPARCFGYVGHAAKTATWKLPYRLANGAVDEKRLPKAIQAILSNYRGVKVSGIPEEEIPMVLLRLGGAAAKLGRMSFQSDSPAPVYCQLRDALEQVGLLAELSQGK